MKKRVGEYTYYTTCRTCNADIIPFLNLGYMPLAGGFLKKKDIKNENYYPLELCFCKKCLLVQTNSVIDKQTLFKTYFYRSSAIKTLVAHFNDIAEEFSQLSFTSPSPFVVEIGSNDGSFLTALMEKNFNVVGIDPAENIVKPLIKKGMPIINDYFSKKLAKKIILLHGKADIIFSANTLAHIENMHDVLKGITELLKDTGVLILEVHYLGSVIENLQYDMIYHEHQYYYSLLALENLLHIYNLNVFDVKPITIHAGSIRYYIQRIKGERKVTERVQLLRKEEKEKKFTNISTYISFGKKIERNKKKMHALLSMLKKQKKEIIGYGASGRGTILGNYIGIDGKYLSCIVDDAPVKNGYLSPGTHVSIRDSSVLASKKRPDFALLFAWPFLKEIVKRHEKYLQLGGKFIVPLPHIKIIDRKNI